jgi:hypothetical protein
MHGFTGTTATVVAPDGTDDAPLPDLGGLRPTLDGVAHISEGDGAELIVTPFTGAYTVRLFAGDKPTSLDVRRGQQQASDTLTRWNDLTVPAGSHLNLTLSAAGTTSLQATDPDTGNQTTQPPTASVSGLFATFG